jgi:hypothetical protein
MSSKGYEKIQGNVFNAIPRDGNYLIRINYSYQSKSISNPRSSTLQFLTIYKISLLRQFLIM